MSATMKEASSAAWQRQIIKIIGDAISTRNPKSGAVQLTELLQSLASGASELPLQEFIADTIWFYANQHTTEAVVKDSAPDSPWAALCNLVKEIKTAKLVEAALLQTVLDVELLVSCGMATSTDAVTKQLIKINTRMLYRQQKYSLLREETEGFSKLLAILSAFPDYHSNSCSDAINQILSIIGQFDLDPNRVIEVILDVFQQFPLKFSFVKLLKALKSSNIVHILGLKFAHYSFLSAAADSKATDDGVVPQPEDSPLPAPMSLYLVAAALIGSKLVSLNDLMPYTSPDPTVLKDACDLLDEAVVRKMDGYGKISLNAKKPAEADGNKKESSGAASEAADGTVEETNYHLVGLAAGFLDLRLFSLAEAAMSLLDQGGVDVMRFTVLQVGLGKLLLWQLNGLYDECSCRHLQLSRPLEKAADVLTGMGDLFPSQESPLHALEQFPAQVFPSLRLLGHRIAGNVQLFTVVCRLLQHRLKSAKSDSAESIPFVSECLATVLLPSLTAGECSTFYSSQLWAVLSLLPFQTRFEVYDSWYLDCTGKAAASLKHHDVTFAEIRCLHSAKALLKRLARENTKLIGRQLARLTHFAPIVVFEYILAHIEHYDNLIPYVVEALRYTTDLAKDAMVYLFVTHLKNSPEASRVSQGKDGYSNKFTTLSKFIATFYKRYPQTCLRGLLHFLLQCLSNGDCTPLLALQNLLCIMGGCESLQNISQAQLEGLSGGKGLRSETMGAAVKDPPSKRAIRVLRDELIASGTAIPLLLLIAQIRARIIHTSSASGVQGIKLISSLYDLSQDVLLMFSDFLLGSDPQVGGGVPSLIRSLEPIATMMPSFRELVDDIGLSLPVAFQLVRPLLRAALSFGFNPDEESLPSYLKPWHPLGSDYLELTQAYQATRVEECQGSERSLPSLIISAKFVILFWCYSIYDISVPSASYELEHKRLKERYAELMHAGVAAPVSAAEVDRANKQRKLDMNKIMSTIKDLSAEQEAQRKHVENTKKQLGSVNAEFFSVSIGAEPDERVVDVQMNAIVDQVMQTCVFDRCVGSAVDAAYCVQFIFLLHEIDTNFFSTAMLLDKMVNCLVPMLFCTTEAEASYLGFCLQYLLRQASRWNDSRSLYDTEAGGKIGFLYSWSTRSVHITYDQYARIFNHWESNIQSILLKALRSNQYTFRRSALLFIPRVATVFPSKASIGNAIIEELEATEKSLNDSKGAPDLIVMTKSISALLQRDSSRWKQDEQVKSSKVKRSDTTSAAAAVKKEPSKLVKQSTSGIGSSGQLHQKVAEVKTRRKDDDIELGEEPEPKETAESSLNATAKPFVPVDSAVSNSNRGAKRKIFGEENAKDRPLEESGDKRYRTDRNANDSRDKKDIRDVPSGDNRQRDQRDQRRDSHRDQSRDQPPHSGERRNPPQLQAPQPYSNSNSANNSSRLSNTGGNSNNSNSNNSGQYSQQGSQPYRSNDNSDSRARPVDRDNNNSSRDGRDARDNQRDSRPVRDNRGRSRSQPPPPPPPPPPDNNQHQYRNGPNRPSYQNSNFRSNQSNNRR